MVNYSRNNENYNANVFNILHVAEKPSVAREVSKILSRGRQRSRIGRSQYNPNYDFECELEGRTCSMTFTSVAGHLKELEFAPGYKNWRSVSPLELFHAPVVKTVKESNKKLQENLENEASRCGVLILWLDCDREGENIAFEVIEICKNINPSIRVRRARFSALIPRDIMNALHNLVDPNVHESEAVDVRQEIDLRIGAAFTRFQTLLLQNKYDWPEELKSIQGRDNVIISYGPCQFPTLGFIVQRYWDRESHIKELYWSIELRLDLQGSAIKFAWARQRLFDHTMVTILYEKCVKAGECEVFSIKGKPIRKFPPCPLNTIELQRRASRFLKIGGDHVMKLAEELYMEGFISYPRTETDKFKDGTDLHTMVEQQIGDRRWGLYAERLIGDNIFQHPRGGKNDDQAHPPIHPTQGVSNGSDNGWSSQKRQIYELVVRHFLACCSKGAEGHETLIEVGMAEERFLAKGLIVNFRSWLDVYPWEKWSENSLPTLQLNQRFSPTSLRMEEGETQPPPLLTESDLLSMMDRHGIGTDATMAEHIKKSQDRGYSIKHNSNQSFEPTELGVALIDGYNRMDKHDIWTPRLRAQMEADMNRIARGEVPKDTVLQQCLGAMRLEFLDVLERYERLQDAIGEHFGNKNGNNDPHRSFHGGTNGGGEGGDGDGYGGDGGGYGGGGGRLVATSHDQPQNVLNFPSEHHIKECIQCGNSLTLTNIEDKEFLITCDGPDCAADIHFPRAVQKVERTSKTCTTCFPGKSFQVKCTFNRNLLPTENRDDREVVGCVWCEGKLRSLLRSLGVGRTFKKSNDTAAGSRQQQKENVSKSRSRAPGRGRGRGRGRFGRGFSRGRSNTNKRKENSKKNVYESGCVLATSTGHVVNTKTNGLLCFKCGKSGHFANACPSL